MRMGFGCFVERKSMSPLPSSFSAPAQSIIVRESALLGSVKATRAGMFALISPVIMLTDGRCVASIRCMPVARAICARRQMYSSTSFAAVIIRSASSSTTMTMCGRRSFGRTFSL